MLELDQHRLWHIKQCPLLSLLSDEEKDEIHELADIIELNRNESVPPPKFDEPYLYIVHTGVVELSFSGPNGKTAAILLLEAGDMFGNLYENDQDSYGEHCRAITPTVLCQVSKRHFEKLISKYPHVSNEMTKISLSRIARLQIRMAEMMMLSAETRLAKLLIELDDRFGIEVGNDGHRKINLSLSHNNMSRLIGTSREMVTHIMSKFRKSDLVDTNRGWVYLTNRTGLSEMLSKAE